MRVDAVATSAADAIRALSFIADLPVSAIRGYVVVTMDDNDEYKITTNIDCAKHTLMALASVTCELASDLADEGHAGTVG